MTNPNSSAQSGTLQSIDVVLPKVWEAAPPEVNDYYEITSVAPLTVCSFSCHTCELDRKDGRILRRAFLK